VSVSTQPFSSIDFTPANPQDGVEQHNGRHVRPRCQAKRQSSRRKGPVKPTRNPDDYARLEPAWGAPFRVLVNLPRPRRERGARSALSGQGLAVATTTDSGARTPEAAVWAPLDADGTRLRPIDLAGWPRPAASSARLAQAARYARDAERAEVAG
jgi:hypothetical protein